MQRLRIFATIRVTNHQHLRTHKTMQDNDLKIVIASSNTGKIKEIQSLLEHLPIIWTPQSELNIADADETGRTFIENAIIKARHATAISGLPALADDSGLVIDALGGEPGVFSSRFAGPGATDADRIKKVLESLKDVEAEDRTASFHSVIALMEHENDPAPLICHGVWEGYILTEPKGDHGFGFDPIFYVPTHDCSAAELSLIEKNAISHRGQAMAQLLEVFESLLDDEE